jgi:hypothetical protein
VIIPVAGLLLLLSPMLVGGRISRLAALRLRSSWLSILALALQVVAIDVVPGANPFVLHTLHVLSYVLAGAFVFRNRDVPGLWLVALGAASNGVTVAVNGGVLPASASAQRTAVIDPIPDQFVNSGVLEHPHLAWLGDVFAIPASLPLANVFSVGDVLLLAGVGWGAHRICGSRGVPLWVPRSLAAPAPARTHEGPVADLRTLGGSTSSG